MGDGIAQAALTGAIIGGVYTIILALDRKRRGVKSVKKPMSSTKLVFSTMVYVVIGLLAIGVWYNNTHYSSTYKDNFLSSCEENGGDADNCGCALGVIESNYSYSQAKSFDTYVPSEVTDKITDQCGS